MEAPLKSADATKMFPNLEIPQIVYEYELNLKLNDLDGLDDLRVTIIKNIQSDLMSPYYKAICAKLNWAYDDELNLSMRWAILKYLCIGFHTNTSYGNKLLVEVPKTKRIWMK